MGFKSDEKGWGRLPVLAKIGNTEWQTAIWFDTKAGTFLLPLKAEVRRKEQLTLSRKLVVTLAI